VASAKTHFFQIDLDPDAEHARSALMMVAPPREGGTG